MNTNSATVLLGDKEQTMLFNFGTMDHLEDITGEDPLQFAISVTDFKGYKKGTMLLIEAGLKSAYDDRNQPYDFTGEDVARWVKKLTQGQIMSIIRAWGASKSLTATGEGSTDTRA